MVYISLDKSKKRACAEQIFAKLREMILSGELAAGEALPSTRELSRELAVARDTVLSAYDRLVAEGAAYSVAGAGFYVSPGAKNAPRRVSVRDRQTASLADRAIAEGTLNLDSGLPALDLFPREKWNRAVSRAFLEAPVSALGYDDPQGRPEFREVLCSWLKKTRGVECAPDQILVTSGTKQGLTLTAKCLLSAQSEVWLEDPSNANVRQIFAYHTDRIVPFAVDEQGIRPELFPAGGRPDLIFVTPSHQFPMGGVSPLQRRIALIEFARKSGVYLLEDDYDSAFTYSGQPTNSLFELDPERVIYAGTFSKVMFPSIRLGYLVLPNKLVPRMRELKRLSDHHSNSIYQLALMRFIESGEFGRHVRRMKNAYQRRRDVLIEQLRARFGERVCIHGGAAGMHVVVEFDGAVFSESLIDRLLNTGVYVVPVERHALIKGNHVDQIIIGYAGLSENDLTRALDLLQAVL